MATRSFGPVPALLLITTDIPKERIAHPTRTLMIRTGIPEEALMYSLKHQVKKSMIGPILWLLTTSEPSKYTEQ